MQLSNLEENLPIRPGPPKLTNSSSNTVLVQLDRLGVKATTLKAKAKAKDLASIQGQGLGLGGQGFGLQGLGQLYLYVFRLLNDDGIY